MAPPPVIPADAHEDAEVKVPDPEPELPPAAGQQLPVANEAPPQLPAPVDRRIVDGNVPGAWLRMRVEPADRRIIFADRPQQGIGMGMPAGFEDFIRQHVFPAVEAEPEADAAEPEADADAEADDDEEPMNHGVRDYAAEAGDEAMIAEHEALAAGATAEEAAEAGRAARHDYLYTRYARERNPEIRAVILRALDAVAA